MQPRDESLAKICWNTGRLMSFFLDGANGFQILRILCKKDVNLTFRATTVFLHTASKFAAKKYVIHSFEMNYFCFVCQFACFKRFLLVNFLGSLMYLEFKTSYVRPLSAQFAFDRSCKHFDNNLC